MCCSRLRKSTWMSRSLTSLLVFTYSLSPSLPLTHSISQQPRGVPRHFIKFLFFIIPTETQDGSPTGTRCFSSFHKKQNKAKKKFLSTNSYQKLLFTVGLLPTPIPWRSTSLNLLILLRRVTITTRHFNQHAPYDSSTSLVIHMSVTRRRGRTKSYLSPTALT